MKNYADEMFRLLADYVKEMTSDVNHEPITRTSMLSPLGLDSIGRALLIERMMETLQLSAPRYEFYQANNLGELAEIFAAKLGEKESAVFVDLGDKS